MDWVWIRIKVFLKNIGIKYDDKCFFELQGISLVLLVIDKSPAS